MDYTHLGRSGLKVSRICLGTMNFGPHTSEPDSFTIMDEALELRLSDNVLRHLDLIWPGPGGPSPEAYAW
jgi:hypothetical protein